MKLRCKIQAYKSITGLSTTTVSWKLKNWFQMALLQIYKIKYWIHIEKCGYLSHIYNTAVGSGNAVIWMCMHACLCYSVVQHTNWFLLAGCHCNSYCKVQAYGMWLFVVVGEPRAQKQKVVSQKILIFNSATVRTSNLIICIFQSLSGHYANKTVGYINDEGIRKYLGGTPTSLELTGEQWDFPNAWPPLQIIVIQGLIYTNDRGANNLAFELAQNWVYANHKGYLDTNVMFEKVRVQYFIEFASNF